MKNPIDLVSLWGLVLLASAGSQVRHGRIDSIRTTWQKPDTNSTHFRHDCNMQFKTLQNAIQALHTFGLAVPALKIAAKLNLGSDLTCQPSPMKARKGDSMQISDNLTCKGGEV